MASKKIDFQISKQVDLVELSLENSDLSPSTLEYMRGVLDTIFKQGKEYTSLRDRMVSLYGRIHTLTIDSKVKEIEDESGELQELLSKGDPKELSFKVDQIRDLIFELNQHHRIPLKDKRVLALARFVINQATATMSGKPLKKRLVTHEPRSDVDPTHLYEIADLFYQKLTDFAIERYDELSSSVKERVEYYLHDLGGNMKDGIKMAQALIATAHEFAGSFDGQTYPSKNEIHNIFRESTKHRDSDKPL